MSEIVRYLVDKKKTKFRLPLKLSLLRRSRPHTICQGLAAPYSVLKSAPDFIRIWSRSAEL